MANTKIRATAELFLSTKQAQQDAKAFVNDLKSKLQDIESAADKMTVFKDMVEYIAQVDRALSALKANNKDAFTHMFDGMDANLKAQLEEIFGVDGLKLGQLDVLREKLGDLTLKSSIKDVRSFAKEINTLFTSIGVDTPFNNIDEIFSGRTSTEHLKKLGAALANFATIWEDVNSRVSKGFGDGTFGGIVPTISAEIQEEIDKLEQQVSHYQSLIDKFNQTAKMKKSFDNFDGVELDFEVSEQAVDGLIKKYNELNDVLDRSAVDSVEYANALAERAKTAMQLIELNNQLIHETPGKKRLTEFIFNESVEEVALDDFEYEFDDCLKNINKSINATKIKINELKESAVTSFDKITGGSAKTGFNDIGDAVDQTGKKVDTLGKKLVDTSEYIQGISAQLRSLFDVLSKPMDVEYKVMINGQDINIRKGSFEQVSARTIAETYLSNIDRDAIVSAHSHMGGDSGLNHNDLKNIMNDFVLGTAKLGATIGQDGIATWNLAGVAMEDIAAAMDKIEKHANKFGDLPVDKVNEIFKSINPQYTDVAKLWKQSDLDGLAQYIYDIGQKSASALTPVERFQNVLKYFARDIDLEKYKDVLNNFKLEDAGNLFNQIMKAEGVDLKVSDINKGYLSDVTREIKEQQDSMLELRQAAQLTYGEIEKVAKEYYETFTRKDNERIGADFFKKYFTSGEMFDINKMFTDIEFGERDLTGVTKALASYFYIDPDEMIPTDKLNEAKAKLESFMALTEEIRTKNFHEVFDATDNIEIGKYAERIEAATNELQELGNQGLLTADQLESVSAAYKSAKAYLDREKHTYDGYGNGTGWGDADSSDVEAAENAARDAQLRAEEAESDALRYQEASNRLLEEKSELQRENDNLREQITTHTDADYKSQLVKEEVSQLEILQQKLLEVKAAVDTKTNAFEEEYVTVDAAVSAEITSLQGLINKLGEIIAQVGLVESSLKNIGRNSVQLNVSDSEDQLASLLTSSDITSEMGQLEKLQAHVIEVKNAVMSKTKAFVDEGNVVGQVVGKEIAGLMKLSEIVDGISAKVNELIASLGSLRQHSNITGQQGVTQDETPKTPEEQFKADKTGQLSSLTKYINSLKDIDYVSQETREQLAKMREELEGITTPLGLKQFKKDLEAIKNEIALNKSTFEITSFSHLNNAKSGLLNTFNGLTLDQRNELKPELDNAIKQLEQYRINVQEGKAVELEAIDAVVFALRQKLDAYKQVNKEVENSQKKNSKFGNTAMINATAKYNSLSQTAKSDLFVNSDDVKKTLIEYENSYQIMKKMQNDLANKNTITEDDEAAFKNATNECNKYAKALDNLISKSLKLHNEKANKYDHILGADFKFSDIESRKNALIDFAKSTYDVSLGTENFRKNFTEAVFDVKNSDGTFTKMTARFTEARNEIVALAGDSKKVQGTFASFMDGLKGRIKSLSQYFLATISIYDAWRVIRQGVTYIRDIDSALTELKKVTDETDASYANFLQDMSKTGSIIGATVKDLTTMAAEWARLGYTMEEAGKLAESTAILLNVSEFDDATKASEALISTMQAFQYTADESEHVVDILNEVGNNYAVSSDGIATALQDSASALMEGGNSLEQSVALVAAANKVVQDPNSVGSALRTISLRLRGTSVKVLEEMGEETEGAIESTSKLQEKIESLTGVNILTDSGAYKETYTILREIGEVWEDMSDIDQAALLELMAGKNRANTLAAILGNMEDLEGAYESALNAEGSALKENEAYLNSVQGRIDLFKNALQTMWMNLLDTSAVKGFIDVGTGLIKFLDSSEGSFTALSVAIAALGKVLHIGPAFKIVNNELQILGKTTKTIGSNFAQLSGQSTGLFGRIGAGFKAVFGPSDIGGIDLSGMLSEDDFNNRINGIINGFNGIDQSIMNISWNDFVDGQKGIDDATKDTLKTFKLQNGQIVANSGAYQTYAGATVKAAIGNQNVDGAVKKTTASLIGQKVAALAANAALTMGISLLISLAAKGITALVNVEKEAAEAARNAADASHEIRKQAESLEEYKNQIKELRSELDSNTLSETEAYDAREKLLSIQDELIDKYGLEKKGINLVTGAIYDQIAAIDRLSKEDASQWLQNKQSTINKALDFFDSDTEGGNLDPWYETPGTRIDMWGQTQNVIDMINEYANAHDHIGADTGAAIIPGDQSISFYGSVEEVKTAVEDFQNWLGVKETEMQGELSDLLEIDDPGVETQNKIDALKKDIEQLQDVREDIGSEHENWFGDNSTYAANKALIEELQYNKAITEYDTQYGNILAAQYALKDAQAKDDLEASKNSINEIRTNAEEAMEIATDKGQQYMVDYFNTFLEGLSEQEFEIDIRANENGLKDQLVGIIKESGEQGLSALDNNQMIDLANRYQDGEFEAGPEGTYVDYSRYTKEQVAGMAALKAQADATGISAKSLIDILINLGLIASSPIEGAESIEAVSEAYSKLSSTVESHVSINDVLSEATYDNIKLSQEQGDAIKELIGSEKEYADAIDDSNGYVVKNSALLRKLIAQKKQEQKATIQEAKAYGQLQYKNIVGQIGAYVKQMANEVKMTGYVRLATLNNIDALRKQLSEIKQTIQQYALLELSLSDAANAYTEFEKAKERDAQLTYGDSMVEMLSVLNEGFKTGQVGSEAFQAAVKALVPPEVYENIDNVQEKMQAIHDYIDKNHVFADYFTIDEGEISITMDNIKAFLRDGLDDDLGENFGVFTGTIEDFDIAPHIESIKALADAYGITESAALAMLTEFEKYDASWGDIIYRLTTTELDRNIDDATIALEEAIKAQEDYIKSGKPIYDEKGELTEGYKAVVDAVTKNEEALNNATQTVIDNAQAYTQVEAILKGLSGEVKYTQEQADALARSLGLIGENDHIQINTDTGALVLTKEQIDALNEKLTGLKEPTILDVQLAYDQIDYQIQELQKRLDGEDYDAEVLADLKLTDASDSAVQTKLNELTADRDAIQLIYNITTTSTAQDQSTMDQLATWETNGVNIVIRGDTTSIDGAMEEVNAAEMEDKPVEITADPTQANADIDSVDDNNIENKTPYISMLGVQDAIDNIKSIGDALDNLEGTRYVTIAVNTEDVAQNANGNFHIAGGAFASGTIGAPKTETSLVGELGPELLVRNGRWTTVGENGAEFTQVKKGDIIFNHKQTEQLLKNGYVTGRGKAYAEGTSNKWYKGWLEAGSFKDGWQFGDAIKAYVGSMRDISENFATGFVGIFEKFVDGMSMVGTMMHENTMMDAASSEMIYHTLSGDKDAANATLSNYQNMQDNVEQDTVEFVSKDLYDEQNIAKTLLASELQTRITGIDPEVDSVFGEKSDGVVQSAGQLSGTAALNAAGIPWWLTTGASAWGSEAESALNQDATFDEANLSGFVSAGAEILSEKIGGISFGGKTLSGSLSDALTKGISNEFVKGLTKFGVESILFGEGTEEVFSEAIGKFGQLLSYEDDKTLGEMLLSKDALNSYIDSYISGFILGEGNDLIKHSIDSKQTNDNTKDINSTIENVLSNTKPIDESLERKIISGITSEYADYFSDGVGIVIKDAIRTMNEDYGQILSDGYESHATYFSNSADESKNYGGYKSGRVDYGGRTPRSVQADLLMRNPYIVYADGGYYKGGFLDNNLMTDAEVADYKQLKESNKIITYLKWLSSGKAYIEDGNKPRYSDDDINRALKNNSHLSRISKIHDSKLSDDAKFIKYEQEKEKIIDKIGKYESKYSTTPNKIHERAFAEGYDGTIIFDVVDTSGSPNDQYVVFSESQIRNPEELIDGLSIHKSHNKLDGKIASEKVLSAYNSIVNMKSDGEYISDEHQDMLNRKLMYEKKIQRLEKILQNPGDEYSQEFLDSSQTNLELAQKELHDLKPQIDRFESFKKNNLLLFDQLDKLQQYINSVIDSPIDLPNKETGGLTKEQYTNYKILRNNIEIEQIQKKIESHKSLIEDNPLDFDLIDTYLDLIEKDKIKISELQSEINNLQSELNNLTVNFNDGIELDVNNDATIALENIAKNNNDITQQVFDVASQQKVNLEKLTSALSVGFDDDDELQNIGKYVNEIPETKNTEYTINGDNADVVKGINDEWAATPTIKSTTYVVNEVTNQTTNLTRKRWNPSTQSWDYYADGTAHVQGTAFAEGSWGAPKTETSLVGELGPELLVRNGRWRTIGEHGAEFTQVKKGDIIFNHKQTEDLLSNGYVTGRGKLNGGAFASGTAYGFGIYDAYVGDNDAFANGSDKWVDPYTNVSDSLSDAASSISDAADEFKEVFDWIEVRLEELDETLGLLNAQLENATNFSAKNNIIDKIIGTNETKMKNLSAGIEEYAEYASKLLAEVPEKYRDVVQDGAIAIEQFAGEADEKTLEAINNYREWAQKVADLKQQLEEVKTEIRDLAIQKFDNAYEAGDVRATVEDSQTEKLQNAVNYDEERGLITSDAYYTAMMENSNKKIEYLTNARKAMQEELNAAVEAGQIERGSNEWYELLDQMYQVDAQIDEATIELEEFQNAINDIYWDNFDQLINRLDYLKDETQSLIDLMANDDLVADPTKRTYEGGTVEYWTADDVKWTKEGIASLGLYAQQMEIAEYTARQYAEAIDDLEKDYKKGLYSENEYIEKLEELKDAQYENIEAYYDAQEAIKDLNETRVDSIKEGIEKEIEAYEELIEKQKEQLDSEKDLYDFQKSTAEQQKNIAQIERQLAALANDHSLSAAAKRKQLEAELAEAQYELQDTYYNRSVEDKQTALDKELEDFNAEKDAEIQKWDEYLTNIEALVAESLGIVQANAAEIGATLTSKAEEYNLTVSDAIMTPWKDGAFAVSDYQSTFDTAMSSTMNQLEALKNKWQEVIDKMAEVGKTNVTAINKENANYASATKKEPVKPTKPAEQTKPQEKQITVGGKINAGNARIYASSNGTGGGSQYFSYDPIYTVLQEKNGYLLVRYHKASSGATGWFKKSDVKAYAKGTTNLTESGIVNIDELGEELVLRAQNGRLTYMEKGSGVIPADLTSNLMEWGKLDPTSMLEQNRPSMNVHPEIHNTEINLSMTYGDILHIDEFNGNNPEDVAKLVSKQFEKHTKDLNNALRKFAR